jgi:hypothetical protein
MLWHPPLKKTVWDSGLFMKKNKTSDWMQKAPSRLLTTEMVSDNVMLAQMVYVSDAK